MLGTIKKINEAMNHAMLVFAGGILILSLGLIVCNGFIRLFFSPLASLVELVSWCAAIITVFSLGATQIAKAHVFIDILFQKLPHQMKRLVNICMTICALCFFVITLGAMLQYAYELSMSDVVSGTLKLPYWPMVSCIGLGFSGIILALLTDLLVLISEKELT